LFFLNYLGGFDGKTRLNDVEVYDPDQDIWSFVAPMNVPRSGAGVVSYDNFVFAVGGYTTNLQLSSVERFDFLIFFNLKLNSVINLKACLH